MGTSRTKRPKRKRKPGRRTTPYPFEFRLKVVKLFLEDGYPVSLIAQQFGISHHSIRRWSKSFRQNGEQGLLAQRPVTGDVGDPDQQPLLYRQL
jgi:transposase-like protein